MKGRYRFITKDAFGNEVVSHWTKNLIMQGVSNGTGLVARALANDPTFPLGITSGEIGTGSTAPTLSDTNLETPVLTGIIVRTAVATPTGVTLKLFIADSELANGTYREFALRSGTRLFARSLIVPTFTKASGQSATIEYEITIT